MKIVPKIIKSGVVPEYSSQELELKGLQEAKEFLKTEFNAEVTIENADGSKEAKAKNASPGKPAILVE